MFTYNKDIWSLYDDICIKTTYTHLVNIASVSFVNGNVMTDFFCQHHPRIWWFGAHGLPGQLSTEVSGIHWTPEKITTIFLPLTNCIEAWGVLELWQNVCPLRISVSCLLFGAPNRHDPFFEHVCGLLFGNVMKHDGDTSASCCACDLLQLRHLYGQWEMRLVSIQGSYMVSIHAFRILHINLYGYPPGK